MKNNKITRRKATKKSDVAGQLLDGTDVLKNKGSRAKIRRWSFEADIELVIPSEEANVSPNILPMRTLKLDAVSYSTAKEASGDCKTHEQSLRSTNQMFAVAKMKVRAIPHETVSNTTIHQLSGYRDMAMILDRALGMAIEEAELVVAGKSIGSQFVPVEGITPDPEHNEPGAPARTAATIKEDFYKRAMDDLRPKTVENVTAIAEVETDPKPFVPEIVEIQRVAAE